VTIAISETDRQNAEAMIEAMAVELSAAGSAFRDLRSDVMAELLVTGDQPEAVAGIATLLSDGYRTIVGEDAPAPSADGRYRSDISVIPAILSAATPMTIAAMVSVVLLVYRRDIAGLIARLKSIGLEFRDGEAVKKISATFSAQADAAEGKLKRK
jgi:hypothetical protein